MTTAIERPTWATETTDDKHVGDNIRVINWQGDSSDDVRTVGLHLVQWLYDDAEPTITIEADDHGGASDLDFRNAEELRNFAHALLDVADQVDAILGGAK